MNKVVLIGRLTKDPDLRFTPGQGYRVEILDGGFVYAEKGKEVDRGCEVCAEVNFNASRK